jgi:hypothetical protein
MSLATNPWAKLRRLDYADWIERPTVKAVRLSLDLQQRQLKLQLL